MRRLSVNWEGHLIPSPHGDYVEYRDVMDLEDEIVRLRRALLAEQERSHVLASRSAAQVQPAAAGGRLFGWVCPDDARKFKSGHKESCRVFKKRTELFCMPVSNILGPNHYQKPPVGAVVTVLDNRPAKVLEHVDQGLLVELDGVPGVVSKWSWKR